MCLVEHVVHVCVQIGSMYVYEVDRFLTLDPAVTVGNCLSNPAQNILSGW